MQCFFSQQTYSGDSSSSVFANARKWPGMNLTSTGRNILHLKCIMAWQMHANIIILIRWELKNQTEFLNTQPTVHLLSCAAWSKCMAACCSQCRMQSTKLQVSSLYAHFIITFIHTFERPIWILLWLLLQYFFYFMVIFVGCGACCGTEHWHVPNVVQIYFILWMKRYCFAQTHNNYCFHFIYYYFFRHMLGKFN